MTTAEWGWGQSSARARWQIVVALSLGLLFLVSGPALAETESDPIAEIEAAMAEAAETTGLGHPAMWKFSDEDTEIYLLGSIHVLKPGTTWRTPEMDAAFDASDRVVFETRGESAEGPDDFMNLMFREGHFTDGTRLSSLLDDAEKQLVSDVLAEVGMPFAAVEGLKPWVVSLLAVLEFYELEGYSSEYGVDSTYESAALEQGKQILALETGADAFEAISTGSQEDQVDDLVLMAKTQPIAAEYLEFSIREWLDGDVVGQAAMDSDPSENDEWTDALLLDRNRKWLPQLIAFLDEPGTVFVVVGAAHLTSQDNVINMLEAEGISVEGPF